MSDQIKAFYSNPVEGETARNMWSTTIWVGVLSIVMLAGLALGTVSANEETGEENASSQLATNPELSAVRRYRESSSADVERDVLAINPELMSARRYAGGREIKSETDLSTNPELSVANRFDDERASAAEDASLHQNPELKLVHGLPIEVDGEMDSEYLSINPELKAHQRFVQGIGQ